MIHLNEEQRRLWKLAWPAIMGNISQTLLNLVDMMMVGQLGSLALAAVGLGGQVSWFMMPIMAAVATGTLALVARFVGAGEGDKATLTLEQSLYLAFLLGIPVMLFGWVFGDDILRIMGAKPDVIALGYEYIKVLFAFYPIRFAGFTAFSALRGAGDTKTPMKLGILMNIINATFDYLLIFGKLGFPELGPVGAAWASGLGITTSFLLGLYLLWSGRLVLQFKPSWSFHPEMASRILRIGVPTMIERGIFSFYNFLYMSIVTRFGTVALAAHQVGLRVESIAYMPAFGFNVATSALVGQSLGEGNPEKAERTVYEALKMVGVFMGIMAVVMIAFPRYLVMPFLNPSDPNYNEVLRLASIYLIIVGISEIPLGWLFVLGGALRGAGDTKTPMYITAISKLLFRIVPAYLLGFGFTIGPIHFEGLGVIAAWIAMSLETFTTAALFWWAFKRGRWKYVKV
ncbi:Na+-driven multidrug efflux pump protein [Thermococcus cleftensis]|uniref:Multidrug-efflux transporter n=1 Tax=Thermococcus cleftensis (strain DSM 27260 / KACC 17922 / CL1) TaxID=163003 RepID=I3ZRH5_THECF|nr:MULTISPECIES: MATE family efflux transporter [Thermococcus]AFL94309.1 Na+-driven multidrug efflux pump protein [Thermococcus cleftensis]NJE03342.1 MATE family efflux transporter [Thermococcus sp. MV11]